MINIKANIILINYFHNYSTNYLNISIYNSIFFLKIFILFRILSYLISISALIQIKLPLTYNKVLQGLILLNNSYILFKLIEKLIN